MSGTINYLYDPAQDVYVITEACADPTGVTAVRAGVVKYVIGEVLTTGTTVTYGVSLTGQSGNIVYDEADVFPDLASAIAEYEIRLT